MKRVVFCPSEDMIEEASILAKKNNLPINIGLCKDIEDAKSTFDKVEIIEVPEFKNFFYLQNVKQFFHQNIVYNNDYIIFNKNIKLVINSNLYEPILVEKHSARFCIYSPQIGKKSCKIIADSEELESFEYYVN